MHGRKKRLVPPTAEEIKALNVKTQTYKSLINIIMTRKAQNDHSMETLTLIGALYTYCIFHMLVFSCFCFVNVQIANAPSILSFYAYPVRM